MSNMNEMMKQIYGDRIKQQLEDSARISKMFPMPKLTRKQKIKSKVWKLRYRIASKFAGFDVEDIGY